MCQCKYYEKSEYNHSVIKPAIMFMLSHYKEGINAGRPSIKYQLKGHFSSGQDRLPTPFDIDFLKDHFLTYTTKGITHRKHDDMSVTDLELAGFLSVLTVDINAEKFDHQFRTIVHALMSYFKCTHFAAEFFFYNNALRVIKELSTKEKEVDRVITKQEFLKRIDTSSLLFDEWFIAKRGKAKYYAELRKEYFSQINLSPSERLFVINISSAEYRRSTLKALLQQISRKYSKLSRRDHRPFSPYALILGLKEDEIIALKQELHNEQFRFVDGHDFKGSEFDPASISRAAIHERGPELRIFSGLSDAFRTFQSIKTERIIYEFYQDVTTGSFWDAAISHIKIQLPNYEDIKAII